MTPAAAAVIRLVQGELLADGPWEYKQSRLEVESRPDELVLAARIVTVEPEAQERLFEVVLQPFA
jgi:hypothetical protein